MRPSRALRSPPFERQTDQSSKPCPRLLPWTPWLCGEGEHAIRTRHRGVRAVYRRPPKRSSDAHCRSKAVSCRRECPPGLTVRGIRTPFLPSAASRLRGQTPQSSKSTTPGHAGSTGQEACGCGFPDLAVLFRPTVNCCQRELQRRPASDPTCSACATRTAWEPVKSAVCVSRRGQFARPRNRTSAAGSTSLHLLPPSPVPAALPLCVRASHY